MVLIRIRDEEKERPRPVLIPQELLQLDFEPLKYNGPQEHAGSNDQDSITHILYFSLSFLM